MLSPMVTALGLRVHTGWATAILLGDPPGGPKVLTRCRLELGERTAGLAQLRKAIVDHAAHAEREASEELIKKP